MRSRIEWSRRRSDNVTAQARVASRWSLASILACACVCACGAEPKPKASEAAHAESTDAQGPISKEEATRTLAESMRRVQESQMANPGGIASADDADQASDVYDYLKNAYPFPGKLYVSPMSDASRVGVYRITDESDQDFILGLLRRERTRRKWNPIRITFLDSENVVTRPIEGGGSQSIRGEEKVLRREWVR